MPTTVTPTIAVGTPVPTINVAVVWTGATSVVVERMQGGVATPIRQSPLDPTTGPFADQEAPQGVAVTYRAYPAGAPGSAVTSGSVTLPATGEYLIHPGQPSMSMQVKVIDDIEWTEGIDADAVQPDAKNPIITWGTRQSRAGQLRIRLIGSAQTAAFRALLASSPVLMLSTWEYQVRTGWFFLGAATWTPRSANPSVEQWWVTMPAREVTRPTVVSSGQVTWLDLANRFSTWADLVAAYPAGTTWAGLLADAETW